MILPSIPTLFAGNWSKKLQNPRQIAPEHILCANGAAELIFRLVQAIRPRCALVVAPTFAEYEQALNGCSCRVEYHLLKEEQDFVLDDSVLEKIHPHTGIVFLCNPNNPTGQLVDQKLLERILVRCSSCGALLVVDECFRDFLEDCDGNSMKGWVEEFPNLLILRAFTKHFAMAGLRLGYCLCANPPLLERMAGLGQPWGVSVPAQIAGVAALSDTDYLHRTRELIAQERDYLKQQLSKLPVRVIGSQANVHLLSRSRRFRAGEFTCCRTRAGRHFDSQLRQLLRNAQGLLPHCRALPCRQSEAGGGNGALFCSAYPAGRGADGHLDCTAAG